MNEKFLPEFTPYLELIQSETVREGVEAIWKDLFEQSEWSDIYDIPSDLNSTAIPLVRHTCNVASYTIGLAEVYGSAYSDQEMVFDFDNLIAGALLHGVSKILEYHPAATGPERSEAGKLFGENFFTVNQILNKKLPFEVMHIVVSDSSKTKPVPATREALLVYFADRIDMDIRNLINGRPLRAKDPKYTLTDEVRPPEGHALRDTSRCTLMKRA